MTIFATWVSNLSGNVAAGLIATLLLGDLRYSKYRAYSVS